MFASVGKTVHLHLFEKDGLKTISKYAPKPSDVIRQVSWCHDNSYMAILFENECPQIVSTKDPTNISLIHTISSVAEVTALKFKPNTKRILALGTRNGEVVLYDTKNRCVSKLLGQQASEITCLEFNSPNELIVISNEDLVIFNVTNLEKIQLPSVGRCTSLKCLNRNSGIVAVGYANGLVIVWDINERSKVTTYRFHSAAITGIALSNKEKLLVTTGADNKIGVIDYSIKECIFKKMLHQPINSVDISANEDHMVVGLKDGSIYVYQMADHLKPQICSRMHSTSINHISFVNGVSSELLESDSFMEEDNNESKVKSFTDKENELSAETINEQAVNVDLAQFIKDLPNESSITNDDIEIPEEKVKLDLIKLINSHFSHIEEQLADHCEKLQTLVSCELESLYAVAARWECFKTMEMDEIVRYICGIVSASSDTRMLSRKSDHTNLQQE